MNYLYLLNIYFLPLFFVFIFSIKKFKENWIRKISTISFLVPFVLTLTLIVRFVFFNSHPISISLFDLYLSHHHISISIYIDTLSCVILFLTGYLSLLVARLSQVYLHRETGYQRFYKTIYLFVFGLHVLAMAGTLDLFFAGWEIIGFSSFLLIAFYRDRTRPVKNAYRVYSIYRIADFGLLLGAIIGHMVLKNIDHFNILLSQQHAIANLEKSGWITTLGLLIAIAAMGKSAQFPFINWPARAMEGPTPSSAIFYGALSIHCGVFLLYRTYPLWKHSNSVIIFLISISILTIILAAGIGRVQSNIKGQIAYASVVQIAFMFIELALGFHKLVLVHIICHCLLRCHQLLVSPSAVVDYIKTINKSDIRAVRKSIEYYFPEKIRNTLYSFVFQEALISTTERGFLPFPAIRLKLFARKMSSSFSTPLLLFSALGFIVWLSSDFVFVHIMAYFYAAISVILSFNCLVSLKHPVLIWTRFLFAQISFLLSIYFTNADSYVGIILYMASIIPCWLIGFYSLRGLKNIDMKIFNGLYLTAKNRETLFFISFIGFSGMPFTTAFWAEDILIAEIIMKNPLILVMTTTSLMLNGLIVARILVKTFWGFPTYSEF